MKALVFGSLNIDYVYAVDHIVMRGETLDSDSLTALPGGKGLNQAVALGRAGLDTSMAGMVGRDGLFLKELLDENKVNTKHVRVCEETSGHAIIQVDRQGSNSIVLYGGTNRMISEAFIDEVLTDFEAGDLLLLQNEINMLDVIIQKAKEKKMTVALNPSPMNAVIDGLNLQDIDLLIMNEIEGAQLSGKEADDPEGMLRHLQMLYPRTDLLVTMGKKGSAYLAHGETKIVLQEAVDVLPVIDTTGAGDTFTGYFLSGWARDEDMQAVLKRASTASGIAVGREGAAISIPTADEVRSVTQ